jgi:hypothetical protein
MLAAVRGGSVAEAGPAWLPSVDVQRADGINRGGPPSRHETGGNAGHENKNRREGQRDEIGG